jgi:hypothetical protein
MTTEARNPLRQFRLPQEDETFLNALGRRWETIIAGNERWVIIRGVSVPSGYDHECTDVAIRISVGYPPVALDMAYFHPPLLKKRGGAAPNTEGRIEIEGKSWQQWSRHRTPTNPWMPGEDNLESHYFYMTAWLADELTR